MSDLGEGLSDLAKSPSTFQRVYTKITHNGKGVESLEDIKKYPHLQHVDLNNNSISDLSPLQHLRDLITLNLSHNRITEILDYKVPQCDSSNRWNSGAGHVGSTLEEADLSNNKIGNMADLSHHRILTKLILNHNTISKIEGISQMKFLRVLDLSDNRIGSIRGVENLNIVQLNLDNNLLTDLAGLDTLPRLATVTVSNNKISSLRDLQNCLSLRVVDMSGNGIETVFEAEHLANLKFLHDLDLSGNPVRGSNEYRLRLIFRLQRLVTMDTTLVTAKEKVKALNLHGEDASHRETVFRKYFPNKEFENMMPPFVEEIRPEVAEQNRKTSERKANNNFVTDITNAAVRKLSVSNPGYS